MELDNSPLSQTSVEFSNTQKLYIQEYQSTYIMDKEAMTERDRYVEGILNNTQNYILCRKQKTLDINGSKIALQDVRVELQYPHTEQQLEEIKEAEVLVVRHALSKYNFMNRLTTVLMKGDYSKEETDKIVKQLQKDPHFVDCDLHEIGKSQCESQVEVANTLNFSIVFFSPMRRVIQTLEILFRSHPKKSKIQFVVLPWISETMGWTTSLPYKTREQLKDLEEKYGFNIDVSLFEQQQNVGPRPYFWCVEQWTNKQKVSEVYDMMKGKDIETEEDFCNEVTRFFDVKGLKKVESGKEVYERCQIAKKKIQEYINIYNEKIDKNEIKRQKPSKDFKIAVISHNIVLNYFTAEGVADNQSQDPINGVYSKNVQFYPFDQSLFNQKDLLQSI